jgi:2-polyprenyl-3-methyl-5-hydroxy-6-metoxy-1,4-benzoquinol methylase
MNNLYPKNGQLTLESMSKASWYNAWTTNIFKPYLKGDILEVGCGIGNFTKLLCSYGNVYAFDPDKYCVLETKKNAGSKAKVGIGNIEKGEYFFKEKKFDAIVCINVLEHIKNDKKALKNMIDLLKPGGTLILLVPSHPFLFGEIDRAIGHFRRYEKKKTIKTLKKSGMNILYARRINFLGALGWFVSGKILKEISVNEKKLSLFNKIAPLILPIEEKLEPPFGTSVLIIAKNPQ